MKDKTVHLQNPKGQKSEKTQKWMAKHLLNFRKCDRTSCTSPLDGRRIQADLGLLRGPIPGAAVAKA